MAGREVSAAALLAVAALGVLVGLFAAAWFGWPAVAVLAVAVVVVAVRAWRRA